ncbi:MAG: FAD-binding oxidoreductase [Solirubrobacteraceae bacterium]
MTAQVVAPQTFEAAAAELAQATAQGQVVRIAGAGSKRGWGLPGSEHAVELRTSGLGEIVEHNAGDLTARLEAGVTLAAAQTAFAQAGQMLALDPPAAPDGTEPTIGGILATGDCGPLRHRYGAPRELVLGVTVALSDGTIAQAGGKVIKNVAGYDLGRLFAGSFGTLGLILAVNVRLHPRHQSAVTAVGTSGSPDQLAQAAIALAAAPLELDALDIGFDGAGGRLLARCTGAQAGRRARRAARLLRESGCDEIELSDDDQQLWAAQRMAQRSPDRAVVRVAAAPSALADVIRAARACTGALVGRAALGESFVHVDPGAVATLRDRLPRPCAAVVLDAPAQSRAQLDPWGAVNGPELELMRRIKLRFDPAGTCNPGVFVGGI